MKPKPTFKIGNKSNNEELLPNKKLPIKNDKGAKNLQRPADTGRRSGTRGA
jgi:hypothetical protein